MRNSVRTFISAAAAVLGIAFASAALAQSSDSPRALGPAMPDDPTAAIEQAKIAHPAVPSEFGITDYSILQLGSTAFQPRDSGATYSYDSTGLFHQTGGTFTAFAAPVHLPEGALVGFMDIYACDQNASSHMTVFFTGYSGSSVPVTTDFWSKNTTQITSPASGCGYWVSSPPSPPFVINNNVQYAGGYDYVSILFFGATDGTNKFKGVDFWWKRQVSPGPATATFSDVPTSSPQFKFVEALVSAGITAGCGGGKYCPNDPITRGQMAVFLSVALGLHWPL